MFKIGDNIVYATVGVCKIADICKKTFEDKDISYYVLESLYFNNSTFFVPVENEKLTSKMHPVAKYEELVAKLKEPLFDSVWTNNDVQRKEDFKKILSFGEYDEIICLIKSIETHKCELLTRGKKLHKADETAFKEALKIIYEQINIYKDISKEDIIDLITFNK